MKTNRLWLSALALSTLLPPQAMAQDNAANFPSRPVQVVAATAPGGPTEYEVRLYMVKMGQLLGQAFVLDFKPGGGQVIGANYVAKAAPNGHTMLIVTSSFTLTGALAKDLPFNPIADFEPLSLMSIRSTVMVTNFSVPAKDVKEYLAYARNNPGKLNFGTSGLGSAGHVAGAWLHAATGTKVTFINYKGMNPMILDLVAGRVDVGMAALTTVIPMIKSGKVRALAITGVERSPILPQLQTVAEQALSGFDYSGWLGFSAPAATPQAIVKKLSENFAIVAKMPEIAKVMEDGGALMVGSTPAKFRQLVVSEIERWRKVGKDADITAE